MEATRTVELARCPISRIVVSKAWRTKPGAGWEMRGVYRWLPGAVGREGGRDGLHERRHKGDVTPHPGIGQELRGVYRWRS